jgi:ATP-dependent Clp protease ATP-binding subunit ClpA
MAGGATLFSPASRTGSEMFERFTDEARIAVVAAQKLGRARGYVGSDDLILGVARAGGAGARALESAGVSLTSRQDGREGGGVEQPVEEAPALPFTRGAKESIGRALRAAVARGHNRLGSAHLLAGIIEADVDGTAALLSTAGVNPNRMAAEVDRVLKESGAG